MSEIILNAEKRETGKKAAKAVRKRGMLTGNYYSNGSQPIAIAVHPLSMRNIVYTKDTHLVRLNVENSSYDCILKDVSFDPVSDKIVHFDLLGVSANAEIEIEVPVVLQGQAIGVRDGGIVDFVLHKIRVACIPANMPEHIEVNISNVGMNSSLHISDITVPNVRILERPDSVIVAVTPPRDEEANTGSTTEPELVGQKGRKEE